MYMCAFAGKEKTQKNQTERNNANVKSKNNNNNSDSSGNGSGRNIQPPTILHWYKKCSSFLLCSYRNELHFFFACISTVDCDESNSSSNKNYNHNKNRVAE